MITQSVRLILAITAAMMAAEGARASSIMVGEIGATSNTFPFGGQYQVMFGGTAYQQVYAASLFGSSPVSITSITFYAAGASGENADGTYTLSLSTTSATVNGLSPEMAGNLGANNAVVFTGSLPAYGDLLTFHLSAPFLYDPTGGNLLLNIAMSGATRNTTAYYKTQNGDLSDSSRMTNGNTFSTNNWGLVTTFGVADDPPIPPIDNAVVPEPATLAMLATALPAALIVAWSRRRRGRRAA